MSANDHTGMRLKRVILSIIKKSMPLYYSYCACLYKILATIPYIRPRTSILWVLVGVLPMTSCRDFQDSRTPYKSYIVVTCKSVDTNDSLTITNIQPAIESPTIDKSKDQLKFRLPLSPNTDRISFDITSTLLGPTPPSFTIKYHKQVVLISHEYGYTYKYVLKSIDSTSPAACRIINKELSILQDSDTDVQIRL